ncbi:hypothetical protein MBLNU230_g5960t1 [Neophaeotheca triangularis]
MPKNPLRNLGRRRSSGNALDIQPESPSQTGESSFRVLERPQKTNSYYGGDGHQGTLSQGRPSPGFRGSSVDNLAAGLTNRGSGGTTNSGSSGYYDSSSASARYSSTSTLPSSLDQEHDEELFPRKPAAASMQHNSNASVEDAPLPPPPSFSSRASRAFSFGLKSKNARDLLHKQSVNADPPSPPVPRTVQKSPERKPSPQRERAMTTSSYASTAVPPQKLDLGTSDFGNDFGINMFEEPKVPEEPSPSVPALGFHRTESEPMFPPRSYSRQMNTPSPLLLNKTSKADQGSPYTQDKRNSRDGLLGGSSALNSPNTPNTPNTFDEAPPHPKHASGGVSTFLGGSKPGYSLVPGPSTSPDAPERLSEDSQSGLMTEEEPAYTNRQQHLDDGDRWVKRVELHDPQEPHGGNLSAKAAGKQPVTSNLEQRPQAQAEAGPSRAGASSPGASEAESELFGTEHSTPKANTLQPQSTNNQQGSETSPSGPPSRAIRPVWHLRTDSGTPKRMTKARFDSLRRKKQPEEKQEEGGPEDDLDEDDDDEERARKIAAQRRRQEATMSVYRQQMKKMTGGQPAELPPTRPGLERQSNSAPLAGSMSSLHLGGIGQEPQMNGFRSKHSDDEDDEVPLGILQAHGFPNGHKPPMRADGAGGPPSVAPSVAGGAGGPLPAFARRLPPDPYYGAGLVNQSNRESLAMNGSGSQYGGASAPPPGLNKGHPGGLVGVIAGEERAKAARRATPSGSYSHQPLPSNMPQQMPPMPRTMSMGNVQPQAYSPSGMPPMPGMPGMPMQFNPQDQTQQQIQQLMQMQMQFMQNMMAMQNGQMPQMQGQMPGMPNFPGGPQQQPGSRPMSFAPSQAPNQGRAMTMMGPPSTWGGNSMQQRPASAMPGGYAASGFNMPVGGGPGAGYTPSIAPSERSNVGMPSRYRPVATNGNGDDAAARSQSMTSSMTLQALHGNGTTSEPQLQEQASRNTIRMVDKPKGMPKVAVSQTPDDEQEEDGGWADLKKKREGRKFKWGRRDKDRGELGELYSGLD